jgi:hypothetical protein
MTFTPPLSHEIRYVFSVHGGILIAGVAKLLRNAALMAKLRLGVDRRCDPGSAGVSDHRFSAMAREPPGDCPACFPGHTTRPLFQDVEGLAEERSRANLRQRIKRRLMPYF